MQLLLQGEMISIHDVNAGQTWEKQQGRACTTHTGLASSVSQVETQQGRVIPTECQVPPRGQCAPKTSLLGEIEDAGDREGKGSRKERCGPRATGLPAEKPSAPSPSKPGCGFWPPSPELTRGPLLPPCTRSKGQHVIMWGLAWFFSCLFYFFT